MENANRWYFTKDQLASTPSRKSGIDATKELSYRQQAANFIQDMGQRLLVSQLCINTAIVYMHRFYVFHSFSEVHRNSLSVAALFLAAKVEEQPRKLEHVIRIAHVCLHKETPPLDTRSEAFLEKQFEVVAHENVLLQTLGFVLAIEHPHTYVVKVCQLVKASKDLAQTSYFMATTSLHMTTMCLQYRPTVVACVCIHLACKWSSWKIEPCSEGKEWYYYVDKSVTLDLLEDLTQEFIAILETSPHRFKRKFIAQRDGTCHGVKNYGEDLYGMHGKYNSSEGKLGPVAKKDLSSPGPSSSSLPFSISSVDEKPITIKQEEKPIIIKQEEKPIIKQEEKPIIIKQEEKPVIKQEEKPIIKQEEKPTVPLVQHSPPKKIKSEPAHSISLAVYREKREKEKESIEQKSALHVVDSSSAHIVTSKPQHAFNESEKVYQKLGKPTEQLAHLSKDKGNKINMNKEPLTHPTSTNKVNHRLVKSNSDVSHVKENKQVAQKTPKISSDVTSDPVVLLERVDVKPELNNSIESADDQSSVNVSEPHSMGVSSSVDPTIFTYIDGRYTFKENTVMSFLSAADSSPPVKSKHQKHKVNSTHNSHSNVAVSHNQSPVKDLKTNGSKENDSIERRLHTVENNIGNEKRADIVTSKHEKREKHKSKHFSKDRSLSNHSENATGGIKVKIRKDIISFHDSGQKPHQLVKNESPKTSIKIKLPKPPVPEPAKVEKPAVPIKLVITKDKSGSGSYSTSHKNERESRKRARSPSSQDSSSKHFSEIVPTKHAKIDNTYRAHHADSSSTSKQSKAARHSSHRNAEFQHITNDVNSGRLQPQDSSMYNNVDGGAYGGQQYYQFYPFQLAPPPPPPPMLRGHGHSVGKTNSNPPLPPPLPPQPPPPPPPE